MNRNYLIAFVLWVASVVGVGYWQNNAGEVSERSLWLGKETGELATANASILKLESEARGKESKHAETLASISENYEKELTNVEAEKSKFISGLRSGSVVMRQPVTSSKSTGAGASGETLSSSGKCDEKTTSQLQGDSAEFLYDRAALADEIVKQLDACQALLIADRAI